MSDVTHVSEIDLIASISKESFEQFVRFFWDDVPGAGSLVWNWHLSVLCEELQTVAERVFKGLPKEYDEIFNVSPGTSKSTICSILFPTWVWTRMPQARIITASHTETLVLDLANKARYVIQSEKYQACFPEVKIRDDRVSYYTNTAGGDRLSCTVAGKSPLGFHAHFLIVDDPIDPRKALSQAELKNAADFMTSVLPSRKVDKEVAVTFLIMQRLHELDPAGILIKKAKQEHGARVRHVCLPAELPKGDDGAFLVANVSPPELVKRYINGLMDPKRLGTNVLREQQVALGAYGYAGQYLQNPVAIGGGMFKIQWFNDRVKAAPYYCKRIRYWDRASTQDGGCYTAGVLLARDTEGNYYVENVIHGQWEPDERNQIMRATALKDVARYGKYAPQIWVEREGGSSGRDAWKSVARALAGMPIREHTVTGDKDTRAEPWACQLAARNVKIVEDGTWDVNAFVTEHVLFKPEVGKRGRYKDQVDASAGAFAIFANSRTALVRSIPLVARKKNNTFKIVVAPRGRLDEATLEFPYLLVCIQDPLNQEPLQDLPPAPILGILYLTFADLNPVDYQERWGEVIQPYNKLCADLIMTRDHGKKLWSFLTKKREPPALAYVFCDDGDQRATSMAMAVCDGLNLKREALYVLNLPEGKALADAPNRHCYDITRTSKGSVVC